MADVTDTPRIDWPAERDAMRAPAYFARCFGYDYGLQRGETADERAARMVQSRATSAGLVTHGDRHCPGCGKPQADTTKCAACREKHREYMAAWRRTQKDTGNGMDG